MKKYSFIMLLLLPATIFSQDTISGKVVSDKQQPLLGASVFIPNTTNGVLTDAKGEFTLKKLPQGNTKIVISYIGYNTTTLIVSVTENKPYIITLVPNIHDLADVTVSLYDKDGWNRWGELFTTSFIGSSAYASQCAIQNKEVINFIYTDATHILRAYATAPLLIENRALGYTITVTLADFAYNTETENVDYQVYSLFREMEGSNKELAKWKSNRSSAYAFSLMHFMRALYSGNLIKEGFEIRRLEQKKNVEKLRIQELYKQRFLHINDSLSSSELKESAINRMMEKSFKKDSLKYYRKMLEQDDRTIKLHEKPLQQTLITSKTGNNTVMLHFSDYLHVTYKNKQEPQEYFDYKRTILDGNGFNNPRSEPATITWPMTELILQQGIPVEVSESGYFANIDLFMNGFWGWWEKIATKLPYGYEP